MRTLPTCVYSVLDVRSLCSRLATAASETGEARAQQASKREVHGKENAYHRLNRLQWFRKEALRADRGAQTFCLWQGASEKTTQVDAIWMQCTVMISGIQERGDAQKHGVGH